MFIGEWPGRIAFVCSQCGRVLYRDRAWAAYEGEIDNWLVAPWAKEPDIPYVRCPRHLTQWALQSCGIPRTTKHKFWMLVAERNDVIALGILPPLGQHLAPFPLRIEFEDEDEVT